MITHVIIVSAPVQIIGFWVFVDLLPELRVRIFGLLGVFASNIIEVIPIYLPLQQSLLRNNSIISRSRNTFPRLSSIIMTLATFRCL